MIRDPEKNTLTIKLRGPDSDAQHVRGNVYVQVFDKQKYDPNAAKK